MAEWHHSSDDDEPLFKTSASNKGSFVKLAEKIQVGRQSLTAKHKMQNKLASSQHQTHRDSLLPPRQADDKKKVPSRLSLNPKA